MRILMLTQFYPPIVGGEELHVRSLSRALVAGGDEVTVATLWHEGLAEFEMDEGVRVHRIHGALQRAAFLFSSSGRRFAPPFPDPETALTLRRLVRRVQPDIVHAHNWLLHSYLAPGVGAGAPLVVSLHNYNLICPTVTLMRDGAVCSGPELAKCLRCAREQYGVVKAAPTVLGHSVMRRIEARAVDRFLPVSRAVAEASGLAARKLPFEVVPNFIPDNLTETSEDVSRYTGQLPSQNYLLYVGALCRAKGVDVLLRAYQALCATRAEVPPLVLIGYPMPETPALMSELPTGVSVLFNWPRSAVIAAWRRSLMGIMPSVWPDPCPTVTLEAMAVGSPVIASAVGGLVDQVVDESTGLLVPPGDVEALRHAIARLLADADLRARLGVAGRQAVTSFQARAVVPRIVRIYHELTDHARATTPVLSTPEHTALRHSS